MIAGGVEHQLKGLGIADAVGGFGHNGVLSFGARFKVVAPVLAGVSWEMKGPC